MNSAKSRRVIASLAVGVSGILVFAACAAEADGNSEPIHITVAQESPPLTIDPCDSDMGAVGRALRQNITETLVERDPNTGEVLPLLATEWEQTDDTTWVFTLREGVKFHDGEDLNAEGVATYLNRSLFSEVDCRNLAQGLLTTVDSVEAIGEYELQITTDTPTPILPLELARTDIGSPLTPSDRKTDEPAGTGPYRLAGYTANQEIEYERFDGYWGETPPIETATFVWTANPTARAAMLMSDEADVVLDLTAQFMDDPSAVKSVVSEVPYLRLDLQIAPLDDLRVRQAVAHAIDRDALIAGAFGGLGIPASNFVVEGVNGFIPEQEYLPYDPELARELLAEASADGVPTDTKIMLSAPTGAAGTNGTDLLQQIQGQLAEVGLTVEIQVVDEQQSQALLTKPFDPDREPRISIGRHGNALGDMRGSLYPFFHSDGAISFMLDEQMDELIESASLLSGDERTVALQAANAYMTSVIPVIPLVYAETVSLIGDGVEFPLPSNLTDEVHIADIRVD